MEKDSIQTSNCGGDIPNATTAINRDVEKVKDKELVEAGEIVYEYIDGLKLYILMASISLVYFLLMLDMSIIVTVGFRGSGIF